jgi:hypothetical protein
VATQVQEAPAGAELEATPYNRPALVIGIGLYLVVLIAVLVSSAIALWPTVMSETTNASTQRVSLVFGLVTVSLTRETAFLVLVVVSAGLGSFVHAATSFVDYVGNRRLQASWVWWYVLRLAIGVTLGILFYFAVRGGFFSGSAAAGDVNPFGIAALAGLAGLFSKQATDKLEEMFETLFRVAPGRGDERREDPLPERPQ